MTLSDTNLPVGRHRLFTKEQVLAAIQRWLIENGASPTVEELRRVLGAGSTRTVLRYLNWLEDEGMIERSADARGIRVTRAPEMGLETVPIPLVGEAPAGPLMIAEENIEGWVRLPRGFLLPRRAKHYILRVKGDSMNRAEVLGGRIEDGDLVLVRQQATAQSGDVAVALIDGEATIKRFRKGAGYYVLQPESKSEHEPIIVDRDFSVQGVVVRVFKKGSEILRELWFEGN